MIFTRFSTCGENRRFAEPAVTDQTLYVTQRIMFRRRKECARRLQIWRNQASCGGQEHGKNTPRASGSGTAPYAQHTAVLIHSRLDDGEAHAGAGFTFSRKEWLRDPGQIAGGDSAPVVSDRHAQSVPRLPPHSCTGRTRSRIVPPTGNASAALSNRLEKAWRSRCR